MANRDAVINITIAIDEVPVTMGATKIEFAEPGDQFANGLMDFDIEVVIPVSDPGEWSIVEVWSVGNKFGKNPEERRRKAVSELCIRYTDVISVIMRDYDEQIRDEVYKAIGRPV